MTAVATSSVGPLEVVLSRLDRVQRSGRGYRALCPACGGRSQKLSVTEADDGRVLMHCFAGCPAAAVLGAMGLELPDLFPERLAPDTPEGRRAARRALREASWGAAVVTLDVEATLVLLAAEMLAAGMPLPPEDLTHLRTAVARIEDARTVLRGR
ncbi:hypothetical protein [Aerolutibacter daejeonensis]|uniref:hypothetical protein n=1 Tax=Aerolutibacter daejeonensis TaxID=346181 RepID=UPI00068C0C83|nr:hypothetical protein [Lysobacter daejeonensis]